MMEDREGDSGADGSTDGLTKLPRGPRGEDHDGPWVERRRALAEGAAGGGLPFLGGTPVPTKSAQGNVENLVGFAQVPVGLAGPLRVDFGCDSVPELSLIHI